jgi:hypothetical protein
MTKRLLLHPFLFALFPILALLANNLTEVDFSVTVRPIGIAISACAVFLLFIVIISRNWQKAAIATTFCFILFFSYGHAYELLQRYPVLGFSFGRHRYLVVIYSLLLIVACFGFFAF